MLTFPNLRLTFEALVDADLFLCPAAQHDGPHGRGYRGPGADDAGRHLLLRLHGERDIRSPADM